MKKLSFLHIFEFTLSATVDEQPGSFGTTCITRQYKVTAWISFASCSACNINEYYTGVRMDAVCSPVRCVMCEDIKVWRVWPEMGRWEDLKLNFHVNGTE